MKTIRRETIIYILVFIICMAAGVCACMNKQAMHEDEYYSYYSSNRTYGLIAEGTVSAETVLDELRVLPGAGFDFSMVREVQSWDVHPPVYYFILHLVCSFGEGVFSMWQGLGVNLVCFAVALILMKVLSMRLLPDAPVIADIAILAWGLSPATLTAAVFIRMYMLLTVWILAITLLHTMDPGDGGVLPFYAGLFVLTFLGFMTHYYFLIWLVFLAVAWNLAQLRSYIKGGRSGPGLRRILIYIGTQIACAVCCYFFYPAFPAQMFRGQRGAQATGNFFDMSNTRDRLAFFASVVNRIGFGGILWILTGLLVVILVMADTRRSGVRPRIARWSARDYKGIDRMHVDDPSNFATKDLHADDLSEPTAKGRYVIGPAGLAAVSIAYFLTVAKTALILGDSSIRYQCPILGVVYLILAAGLYRGCIGMMPGGGSGTAAGEAGSRYIRIAAIAVGVILTILIAFNISTDLHGGISFLYGDTARKIEALDEYPDAQVVYVYPPGQSWVAWADMTQLLQFDEVDYTSADAFDLKDHIRDAASPVILYLDHGTYDPGDISALYDVTLQPVCSNEYSDVYTLQP